MLSSNQGRQSKKIAGMPQQKDVLVAKKYDPFDKNKDQNLKPDLNENEFNKTDDQQKKQGINTMGVQLVIDMKIVKDREEYENNIIKKQEEEAKSKKKKSKQEKQLLEEQEREDREKQEKIQQKLLFLKNSQLQDEEQVRKQKEEQELEIEQMSSFKSINQKKSQLFQNDLQKIKDKQSIFLNNQSVLKPPKVQNIFKEAGVLSKLHYLDENEQKQDQEDNQQQKNQIGAKYNNKGEIIPSSIIGKPQWYENQEKRNKGIPMSQDNTINNTMKSKKRPLSSCPMYSPRSIVQNPNSKVQEQQQKKQFDKQQLLIDMGQKIIPIKGSRKFIINPNLLQPTTINQNNKNPQNYLGNRRIQSATLSTKNVQSTTEMQFPIIIGDDGKQEREEDMYLQTIQEEDIKNNIQQIQERLKNNVGIKAQYNNGILKFLHKGDALYLTKEERILKKYDEDQKQMKDFITKISKKLNRREQDSVYIQSSNFRSKLETAKAFEVIQPDILKYGELKYWEKKLRDFKDEDEKYNINDSEAIQLEIIRRPKSALIKSQTEGHPPFKTFSSGQFFQQRLISNKDKLSKIRHFDDREIELLEIVGENKFESEARQFLEKNEENQLQQQQQQQPQLQTQVSEFYDFQNQPANNYQASKDQKSKQTNSNQKSSSQENKLQKSSLSQKNYKQSQNKKLANPTSGEVPGSVVFQNNLQNSQLSDVKSVNFNNFINYQPSAKQSQLEQQAQQNQQQVGSVMSVPSQAANLNRYQQFDIQQRALELNNEPQPPKKTVYKIKKKIESSDEPKYAENVICANWIKEEIRGNGAGVLKRFQLQV